LPGVLISACIWGKTIGQQCVRVKRGWSDEGEAPGGLVMHAKESAESPERRCAKKNEKCESCKPAGSGSFAPRLEHGDDSNHKHKNGANGKSFQPHKAPRNAKNTKIEIGI
jgi:hypothetical protein